jgi:hypothetical protein
MHDRLGSSPGGRFVPVGISLCGGISIRSADKRQAVWVANISAARLIFFLLREGNAATQQVA